jgi:hypothetical protein
LEIGKTKWQHPSPCGILRRRSCDGQSRTVREIQQTGVVKEIALVVEVLALA